VRDDLKKYGLIFEIRKKQNGSVTKTIAWIAKPDDSAAMILPAKVCSSGFQFTHLSLARFGKIMTEKYLFGNL
jgi:hypothetical protein